jgi:hypothetical protein
MWNMALAIPFERARSSKCADGYLAMPCQRRSTLNNGVHLRLHSSRDDNDGRVHAFADKGRR